MRTLADAITKSCKAIEADTKEIGGVSKERKVVAQKNDALKRPTWFLSKFGKTCWMTRRFMLALDTPDVPEGITEAYKPLGTDHKYANGQTLAETCASCKMEQWMTGKGAIAEFLKILHGKQEVERHELKPLGPWPYVNGKYDYYGQLAHIEHPTKGSTLTYDVRILAAMREVLGESAQISIVCDSTQSAFVLVEAKAGHGIILTLPTI